MIKYYRLRTGTLTNGLQTMQESISGIANKARKIIGLTTDPLENMWIRLYKNSEQIVDVQSIACTNAKPVLDMDITLLEGDKISVGFYNNGAVTTAKDITVVYDEK